MEEREEKPAAPDVDDDEVAEVERGDADAEDASSEVERAAEREEQAKEG